MATDKINNYSIGDNNFESVMLTLDQTFRNKHDCYSFSATALKAGSVIEINGSLYPVTKDVALPNMTSKKYLMAVPSSAGTFTLLATSTAPTWSDSKQGFYGTSTTANYKYIAVKEGTTIYKYNDRPFYVGAIYTASLKTSFISAVSENELTHTFAENDEFIVLCPMCIVRADADTTPTPGLQIYAGGTYCGVDSIRRAAGGVLSLMPGKYKITTAGVNVIFFSCFGAKNINDAVIIL